MPNFEERRRLNIQQNKLLLAGLSRAAQPLQPSQTTSTPQPGAKKRKLNHTDAIVATRRSVRVANTKETPVYNMDELVLKPRSVEERSSIAVKDESTALAKHLHINSIISGWTSWTSVASKPTRDELGTLHFEFHPEFLPNKSPEEIMREGCFGGSYFRPLWSKALGITISDDWKEIPAAWREGLDISKYLTSTTYDAEINKYGVKCGQSIEEWEAAGWIAHEVDVRGWFQWYIRFYLGRRCYDDNRQISRWVKCVGERGRWRSALLKKYVQMGIRTVGDEGDEDEETEVSPVVHQTCHHWAWEVRQELLDEHWRSVGFT